MTKAEREEMQRNLNVCKNAVTTFEALLAEDERATKAASGESDREMVAKAAKRSTTEAILLARELGRPGGPPR